MRLQRMNLSFRFDGRVLAVICLFILFLSPVSLMVRGDNVSVNYSFIFFPLVLWIFGRTPVRPTQAALLLVLLYVVIFLTTFALQYEYYDFWERRLSSFVLFLSVFALLVVKIDQPLVLCFKAAVVSVSVLYCLNSFYTYFAAGGPSLGYDLMRPIVQSQRYGFILLMALWLVFLYKSTGFIELVFKYLLLFILINGLGLTFSRSSVAGLLCSSFAYALIICVGWFKKPLAVLHANILNLLMTLCFCGLVGFLSYLCFPDYFEFFSLRLLNLNITPTVSQGYFPYPAFPPYDTYVYDQLESSEGYRLYMIGQVFNYLANNPFFGAGFLGVWVLFSDLNGAAHNQLLDVLFRTGIVGFIAYLYLLGRIFLNLYRSNEVALLCAMVGIMGIGLFHETFKLSQGAFVFAFLAASALQSRSNGAVQH